MTSSSEPIPLPPERDPLLPLTVAVIAARQGDPVDLPGLRAGLVHYVDQMAAWWDDPEQPGEEWRTEKWARWARRRERQAVEGHRVVDRLAAGDMPGAHRALSKLIGMPLR